MQIEYLKTVDLPEAAAGKAGEIRDLPVEVAQPLIDDGYAKAVTEESYEPVDQRADSDGE